MSSEGLPRGRRLHVKSFVAHVSASLIIIAAITILCARVIPINAITAGFAYLLGILGIAAAWGLIEAAIASVAAMMCFNFFFLPPIGKFTIADPQNWVALFTFLATALVASHLSDREKKHALEAEERQRETEQLYALSRAILMTDPAQPVGFQVAQHISRIFDYPAVALYDAKSGDIFRGGAEDLPDIEAKLKQAVIAGGTLMEAPDLTISAIILGGHSVGALAFRGTALSNGALQALLNLVAIAIERVRTEEAANRAEASRQSEEFKSTLLDAIAHEFKTPLTSIKAASTSMLADTGTFPAQFRELATIINEETDRMNQLVTEAVRMAQLDAKKVRLERELVQPWDLVERTAAHFDSPRLKLQKTSELPEVMADAELIQLALRQLVDNALKYSTPGSPIELIAEEKGEQVVIHVRDHGPGIPEREFERLFDKFYRRHSGRGRVPGSGLGLYIAREIARAHSGDLWVESTDGGGSDFRLVLPVVQENRSK